MREFSKRTREKRVISGATKGPLVIGIWFSCLSYTYKIGRKGQRIPMIDCARK